MTSSSPLRKEYEQDSLVFCDGLSLLSDPLYSGTRDGRFIFVLGNRVHSGGEFFTFDVDIVDFFLSKRTRIERIGDMISCGNIIGCYPLDETALVVIGHDNLHNVLHQWLLRVDHCAKTARCDVYRNYAMVFEDQAPISLTVEEEYALAKNGEEGIIFPRDPLSPLPHKKITSMLDQATLTLRPLYRPGQMNQRTFFISNIAFFITKTVIGMAVELDNGNGQSTFDLCTFAVLDVSTGSAYLQEISSSSPSPLSFEGLEMDYVAWDQSNEVAMMCHRNGQFACFGVLNTRRLEFTEIKACEGTADDTTIISFDNGIIVADDTQEVGKGRIVGDVKKDGKMDRFRLIRHPLRVPSLIRLATVALQKRGGVGLQQLQQIADRIR